MSSTNYVRRNGARCRVAMFSALCLVTWCGAVRAHEPDVTKVTVHFNAQGRYEVDIYYDVNAWLLGVRPEHVTREDLLRLKSLPADEELLRRAQLLDHVSRTVRLRFDEKRAEPRFIIIDNPDRPATALAHGSAMARIIRLDGDIPPKASVFDFWASKTYGNIVLLLQRDTGEPTTQILEKGERSRPYMLLDKPSATSTGRVAWDYLCLGFQHIVPEGLDHILFVLGLFLLAARFRPLAVQITAFTLAHTVSLALSTCGVISLSPRIVEPLIALSIAVVAVENICTARLHAWRPMVVFCFGLLHGLGFAGVLNDLGLPRGYFAPALVSFNVGVELGQLAVVTTAFLAVGWWRHRPYYRRRIVIPASCMIALVGLYWTIQRIMM